MHSDPPQSQGRAWVTLLTREAYLPGCLVLHSSLRRHNSRYPLVVLVSTPSEDAEKSDPLSAKAREVLKSQGLKLREVEWLEPANGRYHGPDRRFADTWTKLRFAGLIEYERVVLLDSDMLVRKNMDELMEMSLRDDEIGAVHACTCNPRKLPHYPSDWVPQNCGHTYNSPPSDGSPNISVPLQPSPWDHLTLHTLNSGLVVANPSTKMYEGILRTLHTNPSVASMKFPDQDLLSLHFKGRVRFLGYEYNALKTLRKCHTNIWRDDKVKNTHYILDKYVFPFSHSVGLKRIYLIDHRPWSTRRMETIDDLTEVEKWWWDEFEQLEKNWTGTLEAWQVVLDTLAGK